MPATSKVDKRKAWHNLNPVSLRTSKRKPAAFGHFPLIIHRARHIRWQGEIDLVGQSIHLDFKHLEAQPPPAGEIQFRG